MKASFSPEDRRQMSAADKARRSAATPTGRQRRPIDLPFVVLVDHRESAPFSFAGLRADSRRSYRPLNVVARRYHLVTGDYSLASADGSINLSDRCAIERKSLEDLFGTLAGGRDRFRREHERMREMALYGGPVAVVIESSLDRAMEDPPGFSRLDPAAVLGTMASWPARYGVPWHWCGTRHWAEVFTFRLLERAWRDLVGPW